MNSRKFFSGLENADLEELETAIKSCRIPRFRARLSAVHDYLKGESLESISQRQRVLREVLDYWLLRFRARGIDGLLPRLRGDLPRLVRSGKYTPEVNVAQFSDRLASLRTDERFIQAFLNEELREEVASQLLRLQGSSSNPGSTPEWAIAQECLQELTRDSSVDIWFLSTKRFSGRSARAKNKAEYDGKIRVPEQARVLSSSVYALLNPRSGEVLMAEFPYNSRESVKAFLSLANARLQPRNERSLIVAPGSSWFQETTESWGVFEAFFLTSSTKELNLAELLWVAVDKHLQTRPQSRHLQIFLDDILWAALETLEEETEKSGFRARLERLNDSQVLGNVSNQHQGVFVSLALILLAFFIFLENISQPNSEKGQQVLNSFAYQASSYTVQEDEEWTQIFKSLKEELQATHFSVLDSKPESIRFIAAESDVFVASMDRLRAENLKFFEKLADLLKEHDFQAELQLSRPQLDDTQGIIGLARVSSLYRYFLDLGVNGERVFASGRMLDNSQREEGTLVLRIERRGRGYEQV